MSGHIEDAEAAEFGGEAPTVEVRAYRQGELIHRELCESTEAAGELAERWEELAGVECVVDDLATRHRAGQILEPDAEQVATDDVYPRTLSGEEGRS